MSILATLFASGFQAIHEELRLSRKTLQEAIGDIRQDLTTGLSEVRMVTVEYTRSQEERDGRRDTDYQKLRHDVEELKKKAHSHV